MLRFFFLLLFISNSFTAAIFSQEGSQDRASLVFIHIGDQLPNYMNVSIRQARLFNPEIDIILLANERALGQIDNADDLKIRKISCESLTKSQAHQNFINKTTHKALFWLYTSERFLYLDDLMAQYHLKNVFHIENDVMLYISLEKILPVLTQYYPSIAVTFDNDARCIPGFTYFAHYEASNLLASFFAEYADKGYNDMQIPALFRDIYGRQVIDYLPILMPDYIKKHPLKSPAGYTTNSPECYYNHIDHFNSIFDAAAIGQYLGGTHVAEPGYGIGFINESCLFNPSYFKYKWCRDSEGRRIPYLIYEGKKYYINNLHIHSKNLKHFYSGK